MKPITSDSLAELGFKYMETRPAGAVWYTHKKLEGVLDLFYSDDDILFGNYQGDDVTIELKTEQDLVKLLREQK